MLKLELIGTVEVAKDLKDAPLRVMEALHTVIPTLTKDVLELAKRKVSGEVLKNQSGTLRRKINSRTSLTDTEATGIVGIKLSYAAAHEFGSKATGTTTVREHLRKLKSGNGMSTVKSHTRNWRQNLPERSFLRSALNELRPQIESAIRQAIDRGVKG
jgi:phage gpG-like protein